MRSLLIFCLLLSFVLAQGQTDKVRLFARHSDVEAAGLKGRVKSTIGYQCSLGDSIEHCYDVSKKKFNAWGFLVEQSDTTGATVSSHKYFYNSDGLVAKVIFTSNDSYLRGNETYYQYSFSERRRTVIMRRGAILLDSFVELYDKNGNEIEFTSGDLKVVSKYDGHGLRIWSKLTRPSDTLETSYVYNNQAKVLKITRSDGNIQTYEYDKEGNLVHETTLGPKGKTTEYITGYHEFDKNGNYLKSITTSKQKTETFMIRRAIEYY